MNKVKKMTIGNLCTIEKGKIGIKKAVPGAYPLVVTAEARASHNEYHFNKPAVIIPLVFSTGHGHASIKRIHYQEGEFAVGNILCVVPPKDDQILNANFLYHYLDVYKEELLVSRMKGMANVTLPLPPLEEQSAIVAKVEKLFKYCDELEKQIERSAKSAENLMQSVLKEAFE